MSTHAAIIAKTNRFPSYVGCYLHFDGHPSNCAPILHYAYNTPETVEKLVDHGMVESIDVDGIKPWCDCNDVTKISASAIELIVNKMSVNHVYVFENGVWLYDCVPVLLVDAKTHHYRRDPKWRFRGVPLNIANYKVHE